MLHSIWTYIYLFGRCHTTDGQQPPAFCFGVPLRKLSGMCQYQLQCPAAHMCHGWLPFFQPSCSCRARRCQCCVPRLCARCCCWAHNSGASASDGRRWLNCLHLMGSRDIWLPFFAFGGEINMQILLGCIVFRSGTSHATHAQWWPQFQIRLQLQSVHFSSLYYPAKVISSKKIFAQSIIGHFDSSFNHSLSLADWVYPNVSKPCC